MKRSGLLYLGKLAGHESKVPENWVQASHGQGSPESGVSNPAQTEGKGWHHQRGRMENLQLHIGLQELATSDRVDERLKQGTVQEHACSKSPEKKHQPDSKAGVD
ncbi:hypothetical protein E5D57_000338 [Metarhizium anisopliae]|nr:hypothetical protein E5D57_000338 [Metarhizium anisopliae]